MREIDFATQLRRLAPLFVGGLGLVLMVTGILINHVKSANNLLNNGRFEEEATVAGEAKVRKTIKIDVSGAVEKPGVYEIPYYSRVTDVLITAGGLGPKADRNYVSKSINLAQRLQDGMKIYIPFVGETAGSSINQSTNNPINFSGLVNINSATMEQLDALPGIGWVTAQKIIDGRPYGDIAELLNRKIVTKAVYEKIKSKVSVY